MTVAPLREAKDSLAKASTPEPFSSSKTSNWVARAGGLPAYVQHIAHDLMEKRGKSESNAIQMALGIVKRWCRGGGNVDATTKAAACKASSEWEAKKASAHAKGALQHSAVEKYRVPLLADELAVREAALERVALFEAAMGTAGLVALLEEPLRESAFTPTLKRTASAADEIERHDVYDGAQHVGTISRRRGYGTEGERHSAFALNGKRVTGYTETSRSGALEALRKHLEEAPARVINLPTASKYLVAEPSAYSGETSYKQYSSEGAARHAAGLPPGQTTPEAMSKVTGLAECLFFDLSTLSSQDIPPLRRVQEARCRLPFDQLAEAFSAGELRDFHGRWRGGGAHLTSRSIAPIANRMGRPKSDAQRRYEGGVVRQSARVRQAHASKKAFTLKELPRTIGKGPHSAGATKAVQDIRSGKVKDTEHAHRKLNADGSLGHYSPERTALHQQIISNLFRGKSEHPGKAKAIFTAGGPASGKSALVDSGQVKLPSDVVHVNPDVVREMLPEYKALRDAGREDASSLTHEEASHVSKLAMAIALKRHHHVLVDTVGDSPAGKFAGKIKDAQTAGHEVHVHYATVGVDEALKRSAARAKKTGRHVPESYLRATHRDVSARFAQDVSKLRGIHLAVHDTSVRAAPVIARKTPRDKLVIHDAAAFRQFVEKGR